MLSRSRSPYARTTLGATPSDCPRYLPLGKRMLMFALYQMEIGATAENELGKAYFELVRPYDEATWGDDIGEVRPSWGAAAVASAYLLAPPYYERVVPWEQNYETTQDQIFPITSHGPYLAQFSSPELEKYATSIDQMRATGMVPIPGDMVVLPSGLPVGFVVSYSENRKVTAVFPSYFTPPTYKGTGKWTVETIDDALGMYLALGNVLPGEYTGPCAKRLDLFKDASGLDLRSGGGPAVPSAGTTTMGSKLGWAFLGFLTGMAVGRNLLAKRW